MKASAKKAAPPPRRRVGYRGKAFEQITSNKLIDTEAEKAKLRSDELTVAQLHRELQKVADGRPVHRVTVTDGRIEVERSGSKRPQQVSD